MSSAVGTIAEYFERYTLYTYKKGQVLISNGEKSEYIYYLEHGRVKVYDVTYRGDEIVLHVYGQSNFFPVSHMLNRLTNRYIYEADSEIAVRRAPIRDIEKFLDSDPAATLQVLRQAFDFIESVLDRQALLMAGSARSKLIYELIIQCRRFGRGARVGSYTLDINESDIGARVGLSRETVNREVKKLKAEGLISLSDKRIVIPNLQRLEKKLGRAV